jgi:predicted transcriptional regulator
MRTKKDLILRAIQELPNDADFEDAIDRLLYLAGIERGLADEQAGRLISEDELFEQLRSQQMENDPRHD